jgi:hypothetical protein
VTLFAGGARGVRRVLLCTPYTGVEGSKVLRIGGFEGTGDSRVREVIRCMLCMLGSVC